MEEGVVITTIMTRRGGLKIARYIDAETLIDELEAGGIPIYDCGISGMWGERNSIKDYIVRAPAVNVQEVKLGKWVVIDEHQSNPDFYSSEYYDAYITVRCSKCNISLTLRQREYGWFYGDKFPFNYCPNCGAKMDEKN